MSFVKCEYAIDPYLSLPLYLLGLLLKVACFGFSRASNLSRPRSVSKVEVKFELLLSIEHLANTTTT